MGFGRDEGMLPYSPRSFLGYRLLQEYFAFPEKFLFVDSVGWTVPSRLAFVTAWRCSSCSTAAPAGAAAQR